MAGNYQMIEVGDNDFDTTVLNSSIPVVVDFWATWCPPCKAIEPIVGELSNAYAGKVKVAKVNTDVSQGVASRFKVMNLPTLLVFKDGRVVNQLVGAAPKAKIEKLFSGVA